MNELTRKSLVDRMANIISDYDERELNSTDIADLNYEDLMCIMECLQYGQVKAEREKHPDGWIPFVLGYDEDEKTNMFQCELPDDEQVILVTNGRSVWEDMFLNDGEVCYLDSGFLIVDEIIAWQPMPKTYKPKHIGEATNMAEEGEKCNTISEKLSSNIKMQ